MHDLNFKVTPIINKDNCKSCIL